MGILKSITWKSNSKRLGRDSQDQTGDCWFEETGGETTDYPIHSGRLERYRVWGQ